MTEVRRLVLISARAQLEYGIDYGTSKGTPDECKPS